MISSLNTGKFISLFALAALIHIPGQASANSTERLNFTISVSGFKAGTLEVVTSKNGRNYSTKGKLRPSGLVKVVADIGYDGSVSGSFKGDRLWPSVYNGKADTGSRNSIVKMRFRSGVPVVDSYQPARDKRPYDINPSAQKGTMDPLSGAYTLLRDVTEAELCNKKLQLFDGRRRTSLTVGKPKRSGNKVSCNGTYRRIAGYPPAKLAEQSRMPFTLHYTAQEDGTYKLMEFVSKTTFGSARGRRN